MASAAMTVSDDVGDIRGIVAAPERLYGWAEIAKAGARFVYATMNTLPKGSPGAAAARVLQERGLINLVQKRSDLVRGDFVYIAQRTGKPFTPEHAPRATLRAVSTDVGVELETVSVEKLLPVLERAARFGRPCPTDKQLAERAQVSADVVPAALDALRALNMIRVFPASRPTNRRVLIVASGAMTGLLA